MLLIMAIPLAVQAPHAPSKKAQYPLVIGALNLDNAGRFLAYDGKEIAW